MISNNKLIEHIGHTAIFYVPECKVDDEVRGMFHEFFIRNYDAYTFEPTRIQGFWRRDPDSPIFADINVKYVVSFDGHSHLTSFVEFLSGMCRRMGEECLYMTVGNQSYLIKPS